MATKLNFRARTLDASKPMSIFYSEDLPELADLNAINRSVPAMPSGMEKEEEAEKHLQDILESQERQQQQDASAEAVAASSAANERRQELLIPTPEVFVATDADGSYERVYNRSHFKVPRQYLHVQPFSADQDLPDYDMDEEDEKFFAEVLKEQKKFEVNEITFEDMLDRLEKNSGHNVVSVKEAKLLLKEDDDLILAVYDYWVDKRLRLKQPLIPAVRSDKRGELGSSGGGGSSSGGGSGPGGQGSSGATVNPYVAFRRRTEKMQTRKNRKNDEVSYERMLKLRRDLARAVTLLEFVKRREKTKKENLNLTADIFERRFASGDYEGKVISDVLTQRQQQLQQNRVLQAYARYADNWNNMAAAEASKAGKRPYQHKKKRHKSNKQSFRGLSGPEFGTSLGGLSSDDERSASAASPSDAEADEDTDGPFAFKRRPGVQYHAPLLDEHGFELRRGWPWEGQEEGGVGHARYKYSLASTSTPRPKCLGFLRRRIGRGGRMIFDRAYANHDELWRSFGFTVMEGVGKGRQNGDERLKAVEEMDPLLAEMAQWPHYRPVTPPDFREEPEWDPYAGEDGSGVANSSSSSLLPSSHSTAKASIAAAALASAMLSGTAAAASSSTTSQRPQAAQQPSPANRAVIVNGAAMRTVDAHNAASAVVTSDTIDLFSQPQQQQQQQRLQPSTSTATSAS